MDGTMNVRAYIAEALGTFLFFSIGLMSIQAALTAGADAAPLMVVVSFGFGIGLMAAIFAFGHISGGHFNPAVTVAMAIDRRTTPTDAVGYIVAQLLGALGASVLVLFLFDRGGVASTITRPGGGVSDIGAVVLEVLLTAGFVLVIMTARRSRTTLAPLAIPFTLVSIHLAGIPFSGASVNPARSIGPALIGGDLDRIWIYLVGPIVGAIVGALVYRALDEEPAEGA